MEAIYYDEAAALLGITSSALRHSVSGERKALTLLPRQGQKQRLIKEQVLLFKGKRLSLTSLNPQERQKWYEYAAMAANPPSASVNDAAIDRIIEQKVKAHFLQQEAARLRKEEDAAREKRERLEEENPFLMTV